ncbi:hypothetical protein [Mucilaginibacter sp. UR6-11]|uniref:hypothetical protein n=1 Tax=Mucilaginibacter sp. UR6-11 TaxID=1435644 RepID=UPI001E28A11C|nr:hypothetical protein [Mucilaginibacter sp. UR6-11]MCC8424218.1 hypothetical protein [Mucilaginibacter sp. UR6-11]
MTNINKISDIINEGLINPTIDLTVDYAELALDSFLDNDAIKEVPIVKTIVGLVKGGMKISEIFFAKKLLTFLKEFHNGNFDNQKLQHFKNEFQTNLKYRNKVIENLMIMIERFVDVRKAKIYGNLFNAHAHQLISWDDFVVLSVILDEMNIKSIEALNFLGDQLPTRYLIHNPILTLPMTLLLNSGLVVWLHKNDHIAATLYGVCMHKYGIQGDFSKPFGELSKIAPVEHTLSTSNRWRVK